MAPESTPGGPFNLRDRGAVVTGGGAGIGLGLASGLTRAGSAVAIIGRTTSRLEHARSVLEKFGTPIMAIVADIGDEQAVRDAAGDVVKPVLIPKSPAEECNP